MSSMRAEHPNLPRYPLLSVPVPAGFPSPATDFTEDSLNLDEYLIEHQEATFFVRVTGNSMTGFFGRIAENVVPISWIRGSDMASIVIVPSFL